MKITIQRYRGTQTKHRKAKKGHGWKKLKRIEMDCIWVNLKNLRPPFFFFFFQIYVSLYQNIIYTAGKSLPLVVVVVVCFFFCLFFSHSLHSQLLCDLDFANERHLLCQFDV